VGEVLIMRLLHFARTAAWMKSLNRFLFKV
jgi:hypothetical protein